MRIACRHSHFSKSPSITRHSGDEIRYQRLSPLNLTLSDRPGERTATGGYERAKLRQTDLPARGSPHLHRTPGPGSKCPSPARAAGRLHAGRRGSLTAGAGTPGGTGHSTHPTGSYVPMRPSVWAPTHLDPASGLAYQPRRSYYQPPISRFRCAAPGAPPTHLCEKVREGYRKHIRSGSPGRDNLSHQHTQGTSEEEIV